MPEAKVGRRGPLVIPAETRREAGLEEGDKVNVSVKVSGRLTIERTPNLSEAQEKLNGKLPQWQALEGKADQLAEKGVKNDSVLKEKKAK